MSKKWYNYFVSVDEADSAVAASQPVSDAGPSAAQTVADIAASVAPEPHPANLPAAGASFEEIYSAAEIHPPEHGYTIYKIADMLQSEHIRNLPAEVRHGSILLALECREALSCRKSSKTP